MDQDFAAWYAQADRIEVRVTPKASSNRLAIETGPDGAERVRAHVTAPPEDDKANAAVAALLAKALGRPPSSVVLLRGAKGRVKLFGIERP